MRAAIVALLLIATTALADEPRIKRVSAEQKEEARAALMRAINERSIADGSAFAELVQCGPRLWARIRDQFDKGDETVLPTIVLFDGAQRARDWGFVLAADTETDPEREKLTQSMGDAESRVPIANAVFRRGGAKKLGPHVARLLAAPALPVIRDASEDEIWYEWMLVAFDLEEPIFVIQVAKTRVLVNLDENHNIDWVDLLPDSL